MKLITWQVIAIIAIIFACKQNLPNGNFTTTPTKNPRIASTPEKHSIADMIFPTAFAVAQDAALAGIGHTNWKCAYTWTTAQPETRMEPKMNEWGCMPGSVVFNIAAQNQYIVYCCAATK